MSSYGKKFSLKSGTTVHGDGDLSVDLSSMFIVEEQKQKEQRKQEEHASSLSLLSNKNVKSLMMKCRHESLAETETNSTSLLTRKASSKFNNVFHEKFNDMPKNYKKRCPSSVKGGPE